MSKNVPSEEIQQLIRQVYDFCELEDNAVRQRQLRKWRRLKLLWEGFSQVWYSEVAHDWRVWGEISDSSGSDQAAYDKPVNVFRAYLESIIAALSVSVPPIKCFPDDADNTLDLTTARAGDKISQLVYRHNDAPLLWLHSLFIFSTEGMTAFYNYSKTDECYGTYEEKEYEEDGIETESTTCPHCGYELDSREVQPGQVPENNELLHEQELAEFDPGSDDVEIQYALQQGQDLCPACMEMMDPEIKRSKAIVTRLVATNHLPKTRICLEVYGGLNIKIPNYAKKQKDIPYLIFSKEENYVSVVEEFAHLHGNKDLLKNLKQPHTSGAYNQYDQWARLSPQYQGEYPINVVTVNRAWLRPAAFNFLKEEDAKKLKKLYPNGCRVVYANNQFAEACNESLDDHWTLTENPLSDYLHFDPLGQLLTSVQEITNDLISLVLQTIEHGIGQTFADPAVLNFNAYSQTEVTPGGIFPAVPKSGKSLNEGFHELRTATLSGEVLPFYQNVQGMGQLVSGALPSLFGGQMEGTETASQYSMSRAQALQRLQNTWKLFTTTWKTMFSKVVPMYIKDVKHDDNDVTRDEDGNFVNTFIRKSEMEGKIGKVELEANENLPMSWGQKKDLIMQILTNPAPQIQQIITAPENLPILHEALGLVDFYVPGEDDVIKQYDEIKLLLNSTPIETGDPMVPMVPSVEIDPMMDNHAVEFEVCRKWAVSEVGRQTKISNEPGYQNVLLHAKAHHDQMALAMQPPPMASPNGAPGEKPNPNTAQEAPITGEQNVQTQQ